MAPQELSTISRVVKRCLHLGGDLSLIEQSLYRLAEIDIAQVNEFFDHYQTRVAPLLYWHVNRHHFLPLLTPDLSSSLTYRYNLNRARNFLVKKSLQNVLSDFHQQRIEAILFKGVSSFVSPCPSYQDAVVFSDIDLLVKRVDIGRAGKILVKNGYPCRAKNSLDSELKLTFSSENDLIQFDVHSDLFWPECKVKYSEYVNSNFWDSSVSVSLNGYPARVPSMEDQILSRFIHDAVGSEYSLLLRSIAHLYHFSFLVQQYGQMINWAPVLRNLSCRGIDHLLVAYISLGNRELGLPIQSEFRPLRKAAFHDLAYLDFARDCRPLNFVFKTQPHFVDRICLILTTHGLGRDILAQFYLQFLNGVWVYAQKGYFVRAVKRFAGYLISCLSFAYFLARPSWSRQSS